MVAMVDEMKIYKILGVHTSKPMMKVEEKPRIKFNEWKDFIKLYQDWLN